MNDAPVRAAALKGLIESGASGAAPQPMAEAVVACCNELLDSEEPTAALELANATAAVLSGATSDWPLRLQIARARALQAQRANDESLQLIRSLYVEERELLSKMPDELYQLRICEATNLWQLNRA